MEIVQKQQRHQAPLRNVGIHILPLLSLPVNYTGLQALTYTMGNLSTFILFIYFEDVSIHPKYETCSQVGWIVHIGLPLFLYTYKKCSMDRKSKLLSSYCEYTLVLMYHGQYNTKIKILY